MGGTMDQRAIAKGTIDGPGSTERNDGSRSNGRINVWPKQRLWMNGSSDRSRNNKKSDEWMQAMGQGTIEGTMDQRAI
jgi:hypothetical protein